MSYSRIGWFAGGMGVIASAYVLLAARPREGELRRRLRRARLLWLPVLGLGIAALSTTQFARQQVQTIQSLIAQKAAGIKSGDAGRAAYFRGVAEILVVHPFGVGYSGFRDAMLATDTYRSGEALEEEFREANPHATFLWYAVAGGVPGAVMAVGVFILLLKSMRAGLSDKLGRPGRILFGLVALPFLVMGLTVPYLFNSTVLVVPVGVAAGWRWMQRASRMRPVLSPRPRSLDTPSRNAPRPMQRRAGG